MRDAKTVKAIRHQKRGRPGTTSRDGLSFIPHFSPRAPLLPEGKCNPLIRGHIYQDGRFAGSGFTFTLSLAFRSATRTTRAAAGSTATWLTFARLACGAFLVHRNLCRDTFDLRLRTAAINDFGLRRRSNGFNRSWLLFLTSRLARLLVVATRLLIAATLRLLVRAALMMLVLLARRLDDDDIVVVDAFDVVTFALGGFPEFIAVVALEALLHLRLCGGNDAIVVFGVLQIVFGDDTVTRALRVASKLRILFSDMLRGATNLNVWAGAVIGPRQRIAALAVEVVVIVISTTAAAVVATPATALVLLSWPHRSFT